MWRYEFKLGRDVHSLAAGPGILYAASTGTDELLELRLDDRGRVVHEEVRWRPDPSGDRTDWHHLNSVSLVDGRLLVSGFGRRPSEAWEWKDATEGFVRELPAGNLVMGPTYHPHSICRLSEGELAVCESPTRRVVTSTGRVSDPLPGYARGLVLAEGDLFVGTGRQRRPLEALTILDYRPVGEAPNPGICSLCRLDPASLSLEQIIPIDPYGREVYDIVALVR